MTHRTFWFALAGLLALALTIVLAQERPRRVLSFVGKPGELAEACEPRTYPDSYLIKEEAEFWECDSATSQWAQISVQSPSVPSAHASTHAASGSDSIESGTFDWSGTHTYDGPTWTIGDGTAEDLTISFDLDTDQSIVWDEAAAGGDGFALSDSIVQIDDGAQDDALHEAWNSAYSAPVGYLKFIESTNGYAVYGMDRVDVGTYDSGIPATANNPYVQINRVADQISLVATTVSVSAFFNQPTTDPLTVGTGDQGTGQMTTAWARVTSAGAGGTDDVTLPAAVSGRSAVLVNAQANAIQVWPYTSQAIDGIAVNTAISLAGNTVLACYAMTNWYCVESAYEATGGA